MFNKIKLSASILGLLISTHASFISCTDHDVAGCQPDTTLQVETTYTTSVSSTQATIYTDVVINAPAGTVWATLNNFDKIADWSSSFKGLFGDIRQGGSVIAKFDLGTGEVVDVAHDSLIYQEGVLFGWSDEITIFPGLVDNHRYRVEAISECQSRFIQTDQLTGTTATTTPIDLANLIIGQYKTFNQELRAEVEKK